MTYIFLESFDQYNTNLNVTDGSGILAGGWSGYTSDSSIITGRYGGQALRKPAAGGREDWYRPFLPGLTTFSHGFDCRLPSGLNLALISVREDGSADHLWVNVLSSGAVEVRRGNGGTVLGTSAAGIIATNAWFFFEIEGLIADSGGWFKVYIDGIEVINVSGIDTRNGGTSGVFSVVDIIESGTKDIDNIYVKDVVGSVGPGKLVPITVTGDDANTGFAPLSGSTLYEMVDEAKTDLDTTYISASAVDNQVTFTMTDIAETGTIYAVKVQINAKKTDGVAGRAVKMAIKDDSNTALGSANIVLATAYVFNSNIFGTDPSGAAWTLSAVNGLRAGVKVTV